MAGDWIKMRTSLLTNPKVNGIARALESSQAACRALSTGFNGTLSEIVTRGVMRHVTVSSLLVIWGAANEHTKDGVFENADLSDIDDMVGIPGFGEALVSVGWAVYDEETYSVSLPNFEEYNTSGQARSAGAKSAAQRQKEYRDRKKSDVTRDVTNDVTSNRREEKRREEKNTTPNGVVAPQSAAEPAPTKSSEVLTLKAKDLIAEGVDPQHAADWLKVRKDHRAPLTQTAWDAVKAESAKAGITPGCAVKTAAENSWQGFKATWYANLQSNRGGSAKPSRHAGFDSLDYSKGVHEDGTLV